MNVKKEKEKKEKSHGEDKKFSSTLIAFFIPFEFQ